MRNLATLPVIAALCLLPALSDAQSAPAPATPSVEARVAAQNALFEDFYQTGLKNNPERATSVGDYRYNALLGDASLAAIATQHTEADAFLARLRAISTAGMSDTDLLSHELLERQLSQGDLGYELKNYEMPINQQGGPHTGLADLPTASRSTPCSTTTTTSPAFTRFRASSPRPSKSSAPGMKDGLMPPKFLAEKLPAQCDGIIAANPFLIPTKKFPASFSEADKTRLTAAITKAVNDEVLPAYRDFGAFLAKEYAPAGRAQLSIETLPDGKRRYASPSSR